MAEQAMILMPTCIFSFRVDSWTHKKLFICGILSSTSHRPVARFTSSARKSLNGKYVHIHVEREFFNFLFLSRQYTKIQ